MRDFIQLGNLAIRIDLERRRSGTVATVHIDVKNGHIKHLPRVQVRGEETDAQIAALAETTLRPYGHLHEHELGFAKDRLLCARDACKSAAH